MVNNLKYLSFPSFAPDNPPYQSGYAVTCNNVIPRIKTEDPKKGVAVTYGPFKNLKVNDSSSLPSGCLGVFSFTDTNGNAYIFAGTATNLYRMDSGFSWNVVSKSGGYNTSSGSQWNFVLFGNKVIATNFDDPIQVFDILTDAQFSDLSEDAPRAKYIAVVQNWLVACNTFNVQNNPQQVHWSAFNDPTDWPTPGTDEAIQVQSDFQDIVCDLGDITGIVPNIGSADALIFFEKGVFRMNLQGPPAIFSFESAETVIGCAYPTSIVKAASSVFYFSNDGIYRFDGSKSYPIGLMRVNYSIIDTIKNSDATKISVANHPTDPLIYWAYITNGVNEYPDTILIYNYQLDEFSTATVNVEVLGSVSPIGLTLDDLTSLGYSLDDLPYSLDSAVWQGGKAALSGFNHSHKFGFFDGDNAAATLETYEFSDPMARLSVHWARPVIDYDQTICKSWARTNLNSTRTYSTEVSQNSIGICPLRQSGKYIGVQVKIPSSANYTYCSGVEVEIASEGFR